MAFMMGRRLRTQRVYDAMMGYFCRSCGTMMVTTNYPVPEDAEISINLPGTFDVKPAPIRNPKGETIMISHRQCPGCGYREWVIQ